MTYVITAPWIDVKDQTCVDECPVDQPLPYDTGYVASEAERAVRCLIRAGVMPVGTVRGWRVLPARVTEEV